MVKTVEYDESNKNVNQAFNAAVETLNTNTYTGYHRYWENWYPNYHPVTYLSYPIPNRAEARYRFALELLERGGFTKEQMVKIVKEALRA